MAMNVRKLEGEAQALGYAVREAEARVRVLLDEWETALWLFGGAHASTGAAAAKYRKASEELGRLRVLEHQAVDKALAASKAAAAWPWWRRWLAAIGI